MPHEPKITDQLRAAINSEGKSVYQIAQDSGIDKSTLSRFLAGKGGLSMGGLDRLGQCLGLTITRAETRPKTPKR